MDVALLIVLSLMVVCLLAIACSMMLLIAMCAEVTKGLREVAKAGEQEHD